MLEKSRLLGRLEGERGFHIFYFLLSGLKDSTVTLQDATKYDYLAVGGCQTIDGVDDAAEFDLVRTAMTNIGMSSEEQGKVWAVLAGLLELGNIFLDTSGDKGNDPASLSAKAASALKAGAAALQINQDVLKDRILNREMKAGGELRPNVEAMLAASLRTVVPRHGVVGWL